MPFAVRISMADTHGRTRAPIGTWVAMREASESSTEVFAMTTMIPTIHRLLDDERGASMVEEALLLAVMVIAVMAGVMSITNTLQGGIVGMAEVIGDSVPTE